MLQFRSKNVQKPGAKIAGFLFLALLLSVDSRAETVHVKAGRVSYRVETHANFIEIKDEQLNRKIHISKCNQASAHLIQRGVKRALASGGPAVRKSTPKSFVEVKVGTTATAFTPLSTAGQFFRGLPSKVHAFWMFTESQCQKR